MNIKGAQIKDLYTDNSFLSGSSFHVYVWHEIVDVNDVCVREQKKERKEKKERKNKDMFFFLKQFIVEGINGVVSQYFQKKGHRKRMYT